MMNDAERHKYERYSYWYDEVSKCQEDEYARIVAAIFMLGEVIEEQATRPTKEQLWEEYWAKQGLEPPLGKVEQTSECEVTHSPHRIRTTAPGEQQPCTAARNTGSSEDGSKLGLHGCASPGVRETWHELSEEDGGKPGAAT